MTCHLCDAKNNGELFKTLPLKKDTSGNCNQNTLPLFQENLFANYLPFCLGLNVLTPPLLSVTYVYQWTGSALLPVWHQAITWIDAELLLIGYFGIRIHEIRIVIENISWSALKMFSVKEWPFCPGESKLSTQIYRCISKPGNGHYLHQWWPVLLISSPALNKLTE